MNRANHTLTAAMGSIAALAGVEHGIGEVLQGSVPPPGLVILSWPAAPFFHIYNGEPALTLVPNLLAGGLLAIAASLAFGAAAVAYGGRRFAGPLLLALSALMLLVGAGFGPPLLGLLLGLGALRSAAENHSRRPPTGLRRALGRAWPGTLWVCAAAWLLLMPGAGLLHLAGLESEWVVLGPALLAFAALLLAIPASHAADAAQVVPPGGAAAR